MIGRHRGDGITENAGDTCEVRIEHAALFAITTGPAERQGCVPVTEELAEILQLLMDKYTFQDVDHSWTKLCYYYDHVGP